jgi:cytoskeletal protein CcmA (bactofilin family)
MLVSFFFLVAPSVALAAGPEEMFRGGNDVRIGAGETIPHDLYLAGSSVTIDGTVQGDVAAGAQRVVINGTIEGDLWAGAESVTVNGRVGGDVRVGVNTLNINGEIGRNVLVFGNEASITAQGRVAGDLVAFTATTVNAGQIGGDVSGETATFENAGRIGGREIITVAPDTEDAPQPQRQATPAQLGLDVLRHWVSIVVVGGLLVLLWRAGFLNVSSFIRRRPLASLGSGVIVLIGGIAAAFAIIILLIIVAIVLASLGLGDLTAFAVIGLLLSDALLIFGLVLGASLVAAALLSLAVGRAILQGQSSENGRNVLIWLALGAVLYAIIGALPGLGGLVRFIAALVGLGALALAFFDWRRNRTASSSVSRDHNAITA